MGSKLSYLEGYIKGLHLDPNSPYSRALKEVTRCLASMDADIDDLKDKSEELYDKIEDIDDVIDDISSCECKDAHCGCECIDDSKLFNGSHNDHDCNCSKGQCGQGSYQKACSGLVCSPEDRPIDEHSQKCSNGSCDFPRVEDDVEDSEYDYDDCEECCLDSDVPDKS